ncbi:YlbF family regulator [Desulfosporosinus sp. Sb-LF]|uniref:YlbF family regulator n=1 Tax=Desulfosporosinus sp. Sb-LF TaxID=2560027 RepID=UPI00107F65CB|nr:YlbF family regulator [Desulfosporosinus sp. Sb-LF]TGE32413.1 YlbF family regulator [Desulfosporosinus sp. Sb-LF]
MNELEKIMQKSTELGQSIALTTVYKEYKKAEYDLLHNTEARKLVEDFQKIQQEQYRKKISGIELSKEELEKIKEIEEICIRNPQVYLSNNANTKFQEFMEQISSKIKEGIKSTDKI